MGLVWVGVGCEDGDMIGEGGRRDCILGYLGLSSI